MKEFLKLASGVVRSPLFLAYWLSSATGTVLTSINEGARGWWVYGAISIASTFVGIGIFYWHLQKFRDAQNFPQPANAFRLFGSIALFRICLILVFSPALYYFFQHGPFGVLSNGYFTLTVAQGEQRVAAVLRLLQNAWPWILVLFVAFVVEFAGRAHVVYQGNSRYSLRKCPELVFAFRAPLLAFAGAWLLIMAIDTGANLLEKLELLSTLVLPAIRVVSAPVEYVLSLAGTIYLANKVPAALKTAPPAQ